MGPASRDVSKKACSEWSHVRKKEPQVKKGQCRVLDRVLLVDVDVDVEKSIKMDNTT